MYRIVYSMDNGKNVDIMYTNKSIEFTFDPENAQQTLNFLNSEVNTTLFDYINESELVQHQLDSLQLNYFKLNDVVEKEKLEKLFKEKSSLYAQIVNNFSQKSTSELLSQLIKMKKKYYAPNLLSSPQEYLNSEKSHFFDAFNFSLSEMESSTILAEKVIDYIFYLNVSDDAEVQNKLYKNAVNEVIEKIGNNYNVKSEILSTVLYTFSQMENLELSDFILKEYTGLPETFVDQSLVTEVNSLLKLAIGKTAPNFTWKEKDKEKNLLDLDVAENYILVFWSTSCSHCLNEIPLLYQYTKDIKDVHVVAVALEKDELGFNHHTLNFVKWTNVLGLGKWENSIAKEYKITATPTYFILDKDKKIIAKPEYFEDVKYFFDSQKK